jgi:hypothetical protein
VPRAGLRGEASTALTNSRDATQGQQGKGQPSALAQNLNSVHQKGPSFTSQFLSSASLHPHQTSTLPPGGSHLCTVNTRQQILTTDLNKQLHTQHAPCTGVKPFDFNEPSPDDVVLEKRKQAFKQKKSACALRGATMRPFAGRPLTLVCR